MILHMTEPWGICQGWLHTGGRKRSMLQEANLERERELSKSFETGLGTTGLRVFPARFQSYICPAVSHYGPIPLFLNGNL